MEGGIKSLKTHKKMHRYAINGEAYKGWLAVWLSGKALAIINEVVLRQIRLVPGWVTVSGWVNHLGM